MSAVGRRRGSGLPPIRGDEELSVLARRAADGDAQAEAAFVARTIDDVWRFCAHQLGPNQADDAVQATYIRALRSLKNFRGDSSPKTWLLGVARNTCLDERRALARRIRVLERVAQQESSPAAASLDTDLSPESEDLLNRLETDRREAFVLTQILGLPYEEAALAVGCPVGTIRSRVARARADLLELSASDDADADRPMNGPMSASS
ncbi:MAG: sigma-70 family RNA polymerase sigma factor [Acidimicrobiales bacterium]|nr:sigma-70 family RNA polymerase sigma factor [Acidimicrobiales bacterium]